MYALGIDLGTTFTAAATWRNGHAETASLGSRAASIPSVVLLREDETFLTGEGANRRGLTEPHRVAREFKRRLGDTTPILLGGVPYSAEALMARLLRTVVDEVATREGGPAEAICVSHPANWGPYKTDLLLQAVRLAGLEEPVSFTTEPEAAAVFYAQQNRIEPGEIVAVYDLGGGTFDAAVLRKTVVGFEILGRPEGIERLGGIDFDAAVFSHVAKALGGKLAELDEDDPSAIAAVGRLRDECVQAKEALSSDTDVSIPILLPNLSTEVRLTRSELEAMVRPALFDSIEALKRALRSAGVSPEQLHSVLLVGGSSRMPIVSQLVGAELGRPVAVDAHPKHAVANGAAWLASGALSTQAAPRAVTGTASVGAAAVPGSPVPGVPVPGVPGAGSRGTGSGAPGRGVAGSGVPGPGVPVSGVPSSGIPASGVPFSGVPSPRSGGGPGSMAGSASVPAPGTFASSGPPAGTSGAATYGSTQPPGTYGAALSAAGGTQSPGNFGGASVAGGAQSPGNFGGASVAGGAQSPGGFGGASAAGGFAGANLGAEETRVTTPVGAGPAKFVAPIYGGAPKAPGPPAKKTLTTSRASLLAAGAALIVLLGGGGVMWALTNGTFAGNQGAANPTPDATTGPVTPSATVAPVVPADEQCTDEIKANTRWVCLTKATISGSELKIEYEFGNGGTNFNISGGFHVHIYGTDATGTNPPETRMGAPSNGPWYVEDKQPSVHEAGSSQYETVQGRAKVCARIATSGHRLVADKTGKGTFKTGNCVPLTTT